MVWLDLYSQIHLMAYNPVDLYFRSCRAILDLKSFVFYFIGRVFTCLKSRQLTLQNPKKIKDTSSMTGGHISRFISELGLLSDRHHTRSKCFSLTYSANFLAFYWEQVIASVFIQIQFLLLLTIIILSKFMYF